MAVDVMGPLPSGHSLAVIVDYYSRFYSDSTTIEKVLTAWQTLSVDMGYQSPSSPTLVHSLSQLNQFKEYCEQHGITHKKVTAKWAQANGELAR